MFWAKHPDSTDTYRVARERTNTEAPLKQPAGASIGVTYVTRLPRRPASRWSWSQSFRLPKPAREVYKYEAALYTPALLSGSGNETADASCRRRPSWRCRERKPKPRGSRDSDTHTHTQRKPFHVQINTAGHWPACLPRQGQSDAVQRRLPFLLLFFFLQSSAAFSLLRVFFFYISLFFWDTEPEISQWLSPSTCPPHGVCLPFLFYAPSRMFCASLCGTGYRNRHQ